MQVRRELGDALAEGDVTLQQLVPLALTGARPWLSMPLVEFYRKTLAMISAAMAHLDRKVLVAEALQVGTGHPNKCFSCGVQVEAESISTETGCLEHDLVLGNVNASMGLLAKMCASKVVSYDLRSVSRVSGRCIWRM